MVKTPEERRRLLRACFNTPGMLSRVLSPAPRRELDLPTLFYVNHRGPRAEEAGRPDIVYGVRTLQELIDAFDERERALKDLRDKGIRLPSPRY